MLFSLIHFANFVAQSIFCGLVFAFSLSAIWRLFPRRKIGDYHKRCVLITGCDSGFGKETAIRLDQMGFHVFATCLTRGGEERLKEVCSDRTKTFHLDVTNSEEIRKVLETVTENIPPFSGLWGIVNNAGIGSCGPIEWEPLSNYQQVADVNLWGMIDVTKTFLPLLKQSKGRVINISSFSGRFSAPYVAAYNISKYGVEAFSDALRREMSMWQVRVIIIEPSTYATAISEPALAAAKLEKLWNGLDEEMRTEQKSFYKKYKSLIEKDYAPTRSPKIFQVVDAVVDALTSRSPRTRYVCGVQAKVLLTLTDWLPTPIVDKVLSWKFG